jgi:hypothetical protein
VQEACHAPWRLSAGELLLLPPPLLLLLLLRQHRLVRLWGAGNRWWPSSAEALSAWMQPCKPPTLLLLLLLSLPPSPPPPPPLPPHVDAAAKPHFMAAATCPVMMHMRECCDNHPNQPVCCESGLLQAERRLRCRPKPPTQTCDERSKPIVLGAPFLLNLSVRRLLIRVLPACV